MLDCQGPSQPLPTRVGNRTLAALVIVAVACAIAAAAAFRTREPPRERLILYFESEGPASRKFHARFDEALQARLAGQRAARSEFVAINATNEPYVEVVRREVRRDPDLIVALSSGVALAVKDLAPETPLVFFSNGDPQTLGLVRDINRPGVPRTGITSALPTFAKRIEILSEALPSARHIGVLLESGSRPEDFHPAGGVMPTLPGLTIHWVSADSAASARAAIVGARLDAWYIPYHGISFYHGDEVLAALAEARRPAIFERLKFVEGGGFIAYQHLVEDGPERLAAMAASVLQGVPPSEIPVVRPRRFEIALNLDAARELGITVPKAAVKRADRVIGR